MAGFSIVIESQGFQAALALVDLIADAHRGEEAMDVLAGLVESQTRRRIQNEKRSPDGEPWAPWSARYLLSRRRGHSLLQASGALVDSLAWMRDDGNRLVGSNLVYAAVQQRGGTPDMAPGPAAIPAREYLGMSDENIGEANEALVDWLGGRLQ